MEMKKILYTFLMLQSERNGKQVMIQGQLQLVVLFVDVLKQRK
jgi:hypothetical protein